MLNSTAHGIIGSLAHNAEDGCASTRATLFFLVTAAAPFTVLLNGCEQSSEGRTCALLSRTDTVSASEIGVGGARRVLMTPLWPIRSGDACDSSFEAKRAL